MKKVIKKAQDGAKATKPKTKLVKKEIKPTYNRLPMARSYSNQAAGRDENTPATAQDSANYRKGFVKGYKLGPKSEPSKMEKKYMGEDEYTKMGRWEGQNRKAGKSKNGSKITKAKNGKSFPDMNKDGKVTKKDILIGRGVLPKTAKSGAKMKKCKYGCK
jgi:hypothetical protein